MKQSLLDSLMGLPLAEAKKLVTDAGYKGWCVEEGTAVILTVVPNTVIMWYDNHNVTNVSAGDFLEVTDD